MRIINWLYRILRNKIKEMTISIFCIVFILILVTFFINRWDLGFSSFYNFTIIDVATLLITLFLGVYVSYFISVRFTKIQRKKDIIISTIESFQKSLKLIMRKIYKYKGNCLSEETRNWFLTAFTFVRNDFYTICSCYEKANINFDKELENSFIFFNETVVCDDFVAKKEFNDSYIGQCINSYARLKRLITESKIQLHN